MPWRAALAALAAVLLAVAPAAAQSPAQPTTITPFTDVTCATSATLVRGGKANRVSLDLTNTSTSIAIRIGDSTVTSTKGVQVPPGGSIVVTALADIYCAAESSTAAVSGSEETR